MIPTAVATGGRQAFADDRMVCGLFAYQEHVCYLTDIVSKQEGRGHVGRFLDSLVETYDVVVVPTVVSERLAGMLERRGFAPEVHWAREFEEHVHCWVWRKPRAAGASR